MRIFVTGATGFIGTELVKELLAAGHTVRGLTRSDAGADQLHAAGAEVHRGNLTDLNSLRSGAAGMDAVVNLAFSHDFANFTKNAADEIAAIQALGSALAPGKLLLVTSGTGLVSGAAGHLRTESDPPVDSPAIPRRPEQAAHKIAAERELRLSIVRLPQVHDTRKQGLVPFITQAAREKGISAYVGDGSNRWAAAPLQDVARLYRHAVDRNVDSAVYHAVQEEGVAMREIAETIGRGLNVPVASIPPEKAAEHFGWLGHFAALDMPASSAWTRQTLNWQPTGPSLIEDLSNMQYI